MPPKRVPKVPKPQESQKNSWAGIQDVPFEILAEIFQLHYGDNTPDRTLALVCKRWRAVLLETPMLWRKIEGHYIPVDRVDPEVRRLQRRLELSKIAQLNITLTIYGHTESTSSTDLFEIISDIAPERWGSLGLYYHGGPTSQSRIRSLFHHKGPFSNLRIISFSDSFLYGPSPFDSLIESIVQSRPLLEGAVLRGAVPDTLLQASLYRKTRRLDTEFQYFGILKNLDSLEEINIHIRHSPMWRHVEESYPPLPKKTTFQGILRSEVLHSMDCSKVKIMEIPGVGMHRYQFNLDNLNNVSQINLPELESLSIRHGGFSSIYLFRAPNLIELSLTESFRVIPNHEEVSTLIKTLFERANDSGFTLLMPISLHLDLHLSPKTMLLVLKYWPQLQTLSLVFGEEFAWTGIFAAALGRKKDPLCHNLTKLRLQSRKVDKVDWNRWNEFARKILKSRKNTSFRCIEWMKEDGSWETIKRG